MSERRLGDMSPEEFRAAGHKVVDRMADYFAKLEDYSVLPDVQPGDVRSQLPEQPPEEAEGLDAILADYDRLIEPNITHWQHPGFMAYFPSNASGPGILGEMLASALNSNVMLWRNAPASTELEQLTIEWLRQLLALPESFSGMYTDTASISSLLSLVAARHRVLGPEGRATGLNAPGAPRLRLYLSDQAHSSIDKAGLVLGLGTDGIRHIATDEAFRMDAAALEAAIREDLAAGWTPFCVTATLGTTSTTSVDPVAEIAEICKRHKIWLHVDAAYAGAAAALPEYRSHFAGWEHADSIVFNLHKWFFTPFDASALFFREPHAFRSAFSLVHEYLKTDVGDEAINFNEYGIQLGRRFRALKVWILLRYFGMEGIRARLRQHCDWARSFRGWVEAADGWEMAAPTPFATLCIRHVPNDGDLVGDLAAIDAHNERILERVNKTGRYFLSHTKLNGRYVIRVALGNIRQRDAHVEGCWRALQDAAADTAAG